MYQKELTLADLSIGEELIFEQMGYHDAVPDAATRHEVAAIIDEIAVFLRPRYSFFVTYGQLSGGEKAGETAEKDTLSIGNTSFDIGRIIHRQLRGSEAFACFVATSGVEFEQYQQRLKLEGDMLRVFIADSIGSVIAERTADMMEKALQQSVDKLGWHRTNRFSPGYCGWHVSEQQLLFPLFNGATGGVSLTDSSLMVPIKSVSGIIGLGKTVRFLPYTCGLCDFKNCYKRRK